MDTLEEYNLLDNTLIIYASDHGEQIGEKICGETNFL